MPLGPGKRSVTLQARGFSDWLGNIFALLLTLLVNVLANILPIAGKSTGEVSALYPSLFTPAGFTFAIWSVIYVALLAFAIFQALPTQRNNQELAKLSTLFKVSCAANACWIFAWHYELILLSMVLMLILLGSLLAIYLRTAKDTPSTNRTFRYCVNYPFSLYFGWIMVVRSI